MSSNCSVPPFYSSGQRERERERGLFQAEKTNGLTSAYRDLGCQHPSSNNGNACADGMSDHGSNGNPYHVLYIGDQKKKSAIDVVRFLR